VRKFLSSLLFACGLLAGNVMAGEALPVAADPLLEQRVLSLSEQLRCLVCQNQTIAESHADLAIDLRNQVREQLGQGRSEQQVIDYMVARYGDFVMYKPPFKPSTWLLWYGPLLLLAAGLGLLALQLRRRAITEPELPPDQLARAATLLDADLAIKEPT
jgi:cytochrome c-type biogenesis protein CcmH